MSRGKIEQKAVTKFRELVDDIECLKHNFFDNDRSISWDGTVDLYNGDTDKKENYDYSIDVQIKGRTVYTKKLNNKPRFSLDRKDLENYLKKDGTLLLLCLFKKDSNEFKLYYASLLPYNIRNLLKQYSIEMNKIKIDMKEIKSPEHFELVCRNFKLDKERQKSINENVFNQDNLTSNDGKIMKFYEWTKGSENFDPHSLVGKHKYLYTIDDNGQTTNIDYAMLSDIIEKVNVIVTDKNKDISYDKASLKTTIDGNKLFFGKAFTIDFITNKFNFKIGGTLLERIKQLKFIINTIIYKGFFIEDIGFSVDIPIIEKEKYEILLDKYRKILSFLKKHNMNEDINFDDWNDHDLNKLYMWINSIENDKPVNLDSKFSMLGAITIKDIKLSVLAIKRKNGKFDVFSLWNNDTPKDYSFRYGTKENFVSTTNIYLILNADAYQSSDINFEEMKKSFNKNNLKDEEYNLMNLQLLEVLRAYDINKNEDLLEYAEFLSNMLLKTKQDYDVHYINYAQVIKRKNKLNSEIYEKLINIKNKATSQEIKIACNLLIDNKIEVNSMIKKLDSKTLDIFKTYPIAIFLKD